MLRKIWNIVTTFLLIVVLLLAGIFFLPRLFQITPMAVLSGSMEPTFHVGSLIFVKKTDPNDIEKGDSITFKLKDTVVTHRVITINEKNKTFITQGDANKNADGELPFADLQGKAYEFSIPLLGYLAIYLGTQSGIFLLIAIIAAVILLSFLPDLLFGKPEKKKGL